MAKKAHVKDSEQEAEVKESDTSEAENETPKCFVIMPISEHDDYEDGHFREAYFDLIKPAIDAAGYAPIRADEVGQTNIIHEDILRKLLDSPLAVCDLSSRNPNVLFELGLRQAFDKPTVLLKDDLTPEVFDVGPLRYVKYDSRLKYGDVVKSREQITKAIDETMESHNKGTLVNSLVRLLQLGEAASLPDAPKVSLDEIRQMMRAEMRGALVPLNRQDANSGKLRPIGRSSTSHYLMLKNRLGRIQRTKHLGRHKALEELGVVTEELRKIQPLLEEYEWVELLDRVAQLELAIRQGDSQA